MFVCFFLYSFGTCEPYSETSELCKLYFTAEDYVFFRESDQDELARELDSLSSVIRNQGNCTELIAQAICYYFFAPCGSDDEVYRPTSVCSEECLYVEEACEGPWNAFRNLLQDSSLGAMNCSATNKRLGYLSPCCIGAGIKVMSKKNI